MSRSKSPPETQRECRGCKIVKPLDLRYYQHHRTGRNGWQPRCRLCMTEFKREWRKTHPRKAKELPPLKPGERCLECEGMTHRRPPNGCPRCKLAYVPEAKIEPVLRKFEATG